MADVAALGASRASATTTGPTVPPRSKTFGRLKPHDPEKGPIRAEPQPHHGFAELAAFLASDTERSIWPRFAYLSTLDLAYRAEELCDAEVRLKAFDRADHDILSDPAHPRREIVLQAATSHAALRRLAETDEHFREKLELMESIKVLLDEYNQAIAQQIQVNAIRSPNRRCVHVLHQFLERKAGAVAVLGSYLEDSDSEDLMTLEPSGEPDRLTTWIEDLLGYLNLRMFKESLPPTWGPIHDLSNPRVAALVNFVNALLGVLLLLAAVLALTYSPMMLRPWLFALGSLFFTLYCSVLTGATRSEVLATTAAFASVLVVFMVAAPGGAGDGGDERGRC